jgi:hypothetical protein
VTLTPWFPPEVKPVHVGAYRTRWIGDRELYSWWNGRYWGLSMTTPRAAARISERQYPGGTPLAQDKRWCGLTEPA